MKQFDSWLKHDFQTNILNIVNTVLLSVLLLRGDTDFFTDAVTIIAVD